MSLVTQCPETAERFFRPTEKTHPFRRPKRETLPAENEAKVGTATLAVSKTIGLDQKQDYRIVRRCLFLKRVGARSCCLLY
jgi:hypothetical protein